jgi:hypothetical protein
MTDHPADLVAGRRSLLLAPLLAALASATADETVASPLDPAQTIVTPRDELRWTPTAGYPERSVDRCNLFGSIDAAGLYYTLVRWWPGYMSAPHTYATDRLCVVVSGTWFCNSGADFDPRSCVPAPAGSFVRRLARTPHYDGVPSDGTEPAVIAICGVGPVDYTVTDPSQPRWRKV